MEICGVVPRQRQACFAPLTLASSQATRRNNALEAAAAAAADRLQAVVVDGLQTACTVLVQAPT
jgi:hypothetical protein